MGRTKAKSHNQETGEKMRQIGIYGLALAAVMTAGGCVDRAGQKAAVETAEVINDPLKEIAIQKPKTKSIQNILTVNGDVTTSDDTQISAQSSGKLVGVYVKDGDSVGAGQVVATLDSETLQQQAQQARAQLAAVRAQFAQAVNNARLAPNRSNAAVRQAEAALRGAKAQLQKAVNGARDEEKEQAQNNLRAAKSNLDTAKKQLERARTLVKEGALAEAQLDTAKNGYENALAQYENALQASSLIKNATRPEDITAAREQVRQAEQGLESAKANRKLDVTFNDQVNAARAQVQSAEAQVAMSQKMIREAVIKAPISGRVYGKPLQPGTVVAPGAPIARIVGGSGIYFDGQVPSTSISRVQAGTAVNITVDAFPGQSFPGRVLTVSPLGDDVSRFFKVRVQFSSRVPDIKPGMFALAKVVLDSIPNAVMVPEAAVVSENGKRFVFTTDGSKVKKVPVQVGLRDGDSIQVKGLDSSVDLVVKGQEALVDGMKIRVSK
jgi:HlyD family secretion protein